MEEEKRSREGKLRDRLAKKRKAKEAEMQQAALSERVSGHGLGQSSTDPRLTDTKHALCTSRLRGAMGRFHRPQMKRRMKPLPGMASNGRQLKYGRRVLCTAVQRRNTTLLPIDTLSQALNLGICLTHENTCPMLNLLKLEQEKQAAQKNLEEEERAERQRFHDQVRKRERKQLRTARRHP